jgi:hypothetical protein
MSETNEIISKIYDIIIYTHFLNNLNDFERSIVEHVIEEWILKKINSDEPFDLNTLFLESLNYVSSDSFKKDLESLKENLLNKIKT